MRLSSPLASDLHFGRGQQLGDARGGGAKFLRIVRANHTLARRKAQRLEDARKRRARQNRIHRFADVKIEKLRHGQAGGVQNLALTQFAAAILDRNGRIVTQAKQTRRVRGRSRLTIAESEDAARRGAAHAVDQLLRRHFRLIEMQRDGAVRPGIIELMAAVAADESPRRPAAGPLRRTCASGSPSCSPAGAGAARSQEISRSAGRMRWRGRLRRCSSADGDELIPRRLGAAVPRLAQARDRRAVRQRRQSPVGL